MFKGRGGVLGVSPPTVPDGWMAVELHTGNLSIDADHQQLYAITKAARSVCLDMVGFRNCASCLPERQNHCENELIKLLGDLLSFTLEHFRTEESMMRDSLLQMVDRLHCEMHMEDHSAISSKIEQVITSLDSRPTVDLLRELDTVLSVWMVKHIATYDVPLVSWIEREDSALRSGI